MRRIVRLALAATMSFSAVAALTACSNTATQPGSSATGDSYVDTQTSQSPLAPLVTGTSPKDCSELDEVMTTAIGSTDFATATPAEVAATSTTIAEALDNFAAAHTDNDNLHHYAALAANAEGAYGRILGEATTNPSTTDMAAVDTAQENASNSISELADVCTGIH